MIKGLAITPPVLGRISIGKVIEKNGKRLPEKDDQFTITSQVQTRDGWLPHPLDELLRKEQGGKKGREHKQQQEQQPPQRGQKPPPSCEFSIRGSERDDDGGWRRSCASRAEIDDLAAVEAEYQWRLGFRRVVPGPAAEAAAALRGDRPASKADELLGDFDRMWPKESDPGAWDATIGAG